MCLFPPTVLRVTGRKITHNPEKLPKMNFWRRKPRPFLDQGKAHRLSRLILCFPLIKVYSGCVPKNFTFSRRFMEGGAEKKELTILGWQRLSALWQLSDD